MRVALYARVSTESQAEPGAPSAPSSRCCANSVAAEGDELVGEFCDDGHSGARLDRPGLDALRDAAEAGLIERVWCLSPDRLARAYAYQVIVLDELARFGVSVRVHRRPRPGRRRPASQAAHPGPGRDRRVRAGEDRRTLPARQAVPRPRRGGARLEGALRLPAPPPRRATARRTWRSSNPRPRWCGGSSTTAAAGHHHARDLPPAQRRRRAHPDRQAAPCGAPPPWPAAAQRGLHRAGLLQPHRGRPRPPPRPAQPPGPPPPRRLDPHRLPAIIADETFEAAGRVSRDNAKWSPRRAEPGAWLLRGLVKCGVCGVGTNCHKMRGRNGTWHRYYYCRNHDPIRAGGEDRRCPERNIRADALDAFVFDQIRAALLDPDLLLAGEQAVAVRSPRPPTTNCSPPSWPAWTARSTPPTPNAAASSTSTRPG